MTMLSQRLLVIDDEETVCRVVEGFLGVEGWDVDSVLGLPEADARLKDRAYPVVLCDVHLPGDSTEFLKRFKQRFPLSQVVMFTGDPTIDTVREALQFGAYEYLPKPFVRDELVYIVRRAYEKYSLLVEQERLRAENEQYRQRLEEMVEKRTGQLHESELRYRAVFNRAVDAIFLVTIPDGIICDHNVAATRLLDLRNPDIANRAIRDFVGDQLNDPLRDAQRSGRGEWRIERVTFRSGDHRSRLAHVSLGKVEFENDTCLQVVARDITHQIELAERNALMELELLNAAQLIKIKHPDVADADGILTQVERINGIIRNLMWKTRQEQETSFQEIDLNQLLQEELKFLEADLDFKHNVEKHFSFAENVPTVVGRYSDFSQSFMNVVRNALDAMHTSEQKRLVVRSEVQDGDICVTVRDFGCGIAKEEQDKIFLPFYTTKPLAGQHTDEEPTGTGLGLSTVHKLLTPYGARFQIESEPGSGTSFTIRLPIAPNAPKSPTEFPRCAE
jgi:PAS domain S-box-containing protein